MILVTGGAGYIGSHMLVALQTAGYGVVALDNLSNGSLEALRRVERLTGKKTAFVQGDIGDRALIEHVLKRYDITAVMHFAGLKAVGESVARPLTYYQNNLSGTLTLCEAMASCGVTRLVFSSSATVYGEPARMPLDESMPTGQPTNPYGRSKLMAEHCLQDMAAADPRWSLALLRYFNPVGAHPSGDLGEDPHGIPNNLLPYIGRVAAGKLACLSVFGDDYPTPDGTGVRDYIHVMDLVEGHLKALQALEQRHGVNIWNLGHGRGHSVLEVIHAFERASGQRIPYRVVSRRPGDIAASWADPTKAERELGWRARRGLDEIMTDTWRWVSANPDGYATICQRGVKDSADPASALCSL